jgi:predicted alpha/beta superfamily hydrolase
MSLSSTGTLRLELHTSVSETGPASVYVAGNFNDWDPSDPASRLRFAGAGRYTVELPIDPEDFPQVEYKYTRGSWDSVEIDAWGNYTENRQLTRHAGSQLQVDRVPYWLENGSPYRPESLPYAEILHEAFEIPQLIRTRRISVLLPADYHATDRRYPVLYLQDGQNLFDDYAPYGSWGLRKRLAFMRDKGLGELIVIAIDHAESERMSEFTPSFRTRLGRGQGKQYVRFLADTLKPYVDRHFRTYPDRQHTGIGGSSLGGLISIYAGLMYPEVYSKLMIFSPSLWVVPNIPFHLMQLSAEFQGRIYLYGGAAESRTMVPNLEKFRRRLSEELPHNDIAWELSIDPDGQHNEEYWGREFPRAANWLFFHT